MQDDKAKTDAAKKDENKSHDKPKKESRSLKSILSEYKGEFQKITWPDRSLLIKQTLTVIVTSLMVGAIITSMDYIFSFVYNLFVNLFV